MGDLITDERTAKKLVRDYLEEQGGEWNGFTFGDAEQDLVEAIAAALAKARAESRPPLSSGPPPKPSRRKRHG